MSDKFVTAIVLLLLASALPAHGQSKGERRRARLDSLLTARYFRTNYDSAYVVRPEGRWTLKLRLNQTGNSINSKGTVDGIKAKADLETDHKTTVSVGASYRGLSLGLAINPGKIGGFYNDYELNLNFYSSRLSFDISYQKASSLSGDIEYGRTYHLEEDDVNMKMLNIAGYYTFNHRRFCYPAAFTQSFIQKRSAGSWLVGFSYQGGSIKTTDELRQRVKEASEMRLYVGYFGIGGGYGYNWVLGKKWLLHLSVVPTFAVYNRNNLTIDGERREAGPVRLNMMFNERAAIVHNFSPRYFIGATMTMNNSLFEDDVVDVDQSKWRARAFLGVRF